jgi:hypothetical protein
MRDTWLFFSVFFFLALTALWHESQAQAVEVEVPPEIKYPYFDMLLFETSMTISDLSLKKKEFEFQAMGLKALRTWA